MQTISQNINDLYISMLNNPLFEEFVKQHEDMTIEEISMEYHLIFRGNNVYKSKS